MTFDKIWNQLCRKEPALLQPKTTVEFKSANLQSLLKQVYEQGRRSVAVVEPQGKTPSWLDDLFNTRTKGPHTEKSHPNVTNRK